MRVQFLKFHTTRDIRKFFQIKLNFEKIIEY